MNRKKTILLILICALSACFGFCSCRSRESDEAYTEVSQLLGKRIGIQVGTGCDDTVFNRLDKAEIVQYSTKYDLINALVSGKIDAFVMDEPMVKYLMTNNPAITYIDDPLDVFEYAYMFGTTKKDQRLCAQLSEYLDQLRENGTLERLEKKWFSSADSGEKTMPDLSSLSAENGVLVMATDPTSAPMEYLLSENGAYAGYDIEIALMFAREYGYGLEISAYSGDAILTAVQSDSVDFAGSYICIMPEREEKVLYSSPNFICNSVLCVRNPDYQSEQGFFSAMLDSFSATFIRENRWLLFLKGAFITVVITSVSAAIGTLLGYWLYEKKKTGSSYAQKTVTSCIWLIDRVPVVVFLMILYYVVFRNIALWGTVISIICFILSFACTVCGILENTIAAMPEVQFETAYSLGFDEKKTLRRIILPQAFPKMSGTYNSALKELLKGTSIVGYIGVQDVTMIGDIIRGRIYDAVFPLAAVTVIYLVLEILLDYSFSKEMDRMIPGKHGYSYLLKGVDLHD